MRHLFACLVLLSAVVALAQAQKKDEPAGDGRSWFTTFTLLTGTTTSTTSSTTVVTCTTSTTALTTCTGGRRRRGLFYEEGSGKQRRGLFYNDQEVENDDGSVFIVKRSAKDEAKPAEKADDKKHSAVVGLEVQSGFALPEGFSNNRFGLVFGQATVLSTSIVTSTSTITAACASTTGFPTCANGK